MARLLLAAPLPLGVLPDEWVAACVKLVERHGIGWLGMQP
jgi:hypothetical protein